MLVNVDRRSPNSQSVTRNILIIGSGPAAVFAAIAAKRQDPAADVVLLTDEGCEPYEKPPLSKAVLLGKARPEDTPIAGKDGIAARGVTVQFNTPCTAIDRAARMVVTQRGRLPYDALVIATGSLMRELPLLPPECRARITCGPMRMHARSRPISQPAGIWP